MSIAALDPSPGARKVPAGALREKVGTGFSQKAMRQQGLPE
jgi:hypothetical protein